jgi:hypothetical protein
LPVNLDNLDRAAPLDHPVNQDQLVPLDNLVNWDPKDQLVRMAKQDQPATKVLQDCKEELVQPVRKETKDLREYQDQQAMLVK